MKKLGSFFSISLIFLITILASILDKAVNKPKNSKFEIMGYLSPEMNKVNHNSALALVSLYLDVDTNKLKFFA